MSDETPQPPPLPVRKLTWSVLLAQWVEFARSAVALPTEGDGARMRASIADVITLQAVCFSLGQLDELDVEERGVGLVRAGVLIDRHTAALRMRWGDAMPDSMRELVDDTLAAYDRARDSQP